MASVASDKIVPFGQDFVLDDILVTLTSIEPFCNLFIMRQFLVSVNIR